MHLLKRIRIEVLARLGTSFLRLLFASLDWKLIGESPFIGNQKRIYVFWHSRQLLMPLAYIRFSTQLNRLSTLTSKHPDGRIVARFLNLVGLQSVAGSSSNGGTRALLDLIAFLKAGDHISITPDGPRGPPHVLKPGVIKVAQRSGIPIRCLALGYSKRWSFNSWDKLVLPKPFCKAFLASSADIYVPAKLSREQLEEFRAKVEKTLNELTDNLDRFADGQ